MWSTRLPVIQRLSTTATSTQNSLVSGFTSSSGPSEFLSLADEHSHSQSLRLGPCRPFLCSHRVIGWNPDLNRWRL